MTRQLGTPTSRSNRNESVGPNMHRYEVTFTPPTSRPILLLTRHKWVIGPYIYCRGEHILTINKLNEDELSLRDEEWASGQRIEFNYVGERPLTRQSALIIYGRYNDRNDEPPPYDPPPSYDSLSLPQNES